MHPSPGTQPPPGMYFPPPSGTARPSGATAVLTALLGFAGGLVWLGAVVATVREVIEYPRHALGWGLLENWEAALYTLLAITDILPMVALPLGALLILLRVNAGRYLVAVGSAYVLLAYVLVVVARLVDGHSPGGLARYVLGHSPLNGIFGTHLVPPWPHAPALLVFPLVTLTLALAAPTRNWCRTSASAPRYPNTPSGYPPIPR